MRLHAQRYLIYIGLAGAVVYALAFCFLMGLVPPMSPTSTPDEVVQFFATDNMRFRIGGIVMMFAGGFWLPIGAVISMQLTRHESGFPIWSVLQAMASTLGAWLFAFPALIWYVAAFTVTRNPQITSTLNEFAWLAFLTPVAAFTLQLLPIIVIGLTSKVDGPYTAFPRWLAFLTIWMIVVGEIPVMAILFKTGPFAWNGLISFWCAAVGYGIWLSILAFVLLRALRHQGANEEVPDAAAPRDVTGTR